MLSRSFVLLSLAASLVAADSHKAFPYPWKQEDLPNGLRLITIPTDYPNLVSLFIVVQAGSRNEVEPGHTGFAHLFEHMMFRGTEKVPPAEYHNLLNRAGAASNAFTTDDYTAYHTTFSKEDLDKILELEANRFEHLKYAEPEFKTESLAVLGEYNKNSANPASKLNEVLRDTAYQSHTYKHTTMGFLKDIRDMPNQYEYSLKFFERYYRPEYTTIVVAGDVNPKQVRAMVDKYWGDWKKGNYKPEVPKEPVQDAPRTGHVDWPTPTLPWVAIAYKGPAYTDDKTDSAALDIIAALGFSEISNVYQKLVIQEQKVDAIGAGIQDHVDPGLFTIQARIKNPADMDYVRDQLLATVQSFRDKPPAKDRLEAVKKHLRYRFALSLDNSEAVGRTAAAYVALRRTVESIDKLYDIYASLTPEDIQHAAQKYLIDNNRTIVTLTGKAPGGAQ